MCRGTLGNSEGGEPSWLGRSGSLALTSADVTEAHTLEDGVGIGEASLCVGTPQSPEEALDAVHEGLRLAANLQATSDVVTEHLRDSLFDLNLGAVTSVHLLCALQVGVTTLDALAILDLHVALTCRQIAEGLPLAVGEEAEAADRVDDLVVHHGRDGIEQLLLRHLRVVHTQSQGDDAVPIAAVHLHHALDQGVLRCIGGANDALRHKLHVGQAEVVEAATEGGEELAFLSGVDRCPCCGLGCNGRLLGCGCGLLYAILLDVRCGAGESCADALSHA